MKRLLGWATTAGVAILVSGAFTSAQDRREPQDQNKGKQKTESKETTIQSGRDQRSRGRSQGDGQLVAWLTSDNEGEIALAKFALERAQTDEVKQYAQHVADEHTEFLNKLRKIAPIAANGGTDSSRGQQDKRDPRRPDEPKRTQPKLDTAQTKPSDEAIQRGYLDPEGRADLLQIRQEIAKQCLETTKRELGDKSGAEFDKCFMGQQIMAHLVMADTLKVMKNYASPELRRLLEDGEKATHEHLTHAKEIMKQIDAEGLKRSTTSEK